MTSEDYYIDPNGNLVMTAHFHLKRGNCCGNGCRHCPYHYEAVKDQNLKEKLLQALKGK